MTSHLSISYGPSAAPTASTAPPASDVGSATSSPPAARSPLSFLTALIDQLLAGTASATGDTASTGDSAATSATTPGGPSAPFGIAIDPAALTAAADATSSSATPLLKTFGKALDRLKSELDAGKTPDADNLKKLGDAAQALAALIPAPTTFTNTPAPPSGNDATATTGAIGTGTSPSVPSDAASSASAQALAGFAQELAAVGQQLTTVSARVANQLQDLAGKLDAAASDPQLSAQLNPDASGQTSPLQALAQSLVAMKPATQQATQLPGTPALAAPVLDPTTAIRGDDSHRPNAATQQPAASSPSSPTVTITATAAKPVSSSGDSRATSRDTSDATAKLVATASPTPDSPTTATPAVTTALTQSSTPSAVPAAYQTAQNPINMGQVAFEMVRQIQQGSSRFTIRLDPAELGRVDVKMHVDPTGAVSAKLTVDRAETLDMFQRDRGTLEKALAQAGLDSSKTSLEFSLRQNPFAASSGGQQQSNSGASQGYVPASSVPADDGTSAGTTTTIYRGVASTGGVNLFV